MTMTRLEHILWSLFCGSALAVSGCYDSRDRSPEPPADAAADDGEADVDAADPPPPDTPLVGMYGVPGP